MSDRRYTVKCLAAGQARAYARTVYRYQITYEWQGMEGFKNPDALFVINDKMMEESVRRDAKHFCGWTEANEGDWASTRLVYLKKTAPGVWEWEIKAEFNACALKEEE